MVCVYLYCTHFRTCVRFFFLYHYHFVLYGLYIDRRNSVWNKCVTHIWIVHFRFASDWFSHFQTFYTWFWRIFYVFISSRSHYIFHQNSLNFQRHWLCIGTIHETCEYHPRSDAIERLFGTNSKSSIEISGKWGCGIKISTLMIPYQAGDCCSQTNVCTTENDFSDSH